MMRSVITWLLVVIIGFSVMAPAVTAYADDRAGDLEMGAPGGKKENCRDKHEGKLLAVIVPCIEDIVQANAEYMTDRFDEYVKPAIYAFMTLMLTLFGVKIMSGEGDAKKDGSILLFKIAAVMLFMDNFGGFIPSAFGMVKDGVQIVTGSLGAALSEMECDAEKYGGIEPWRYMDCILGELFGFAPSVVVGSSLFGLMGSALWSGSLGVTLFMGGMLTLFLIVRLVLRATYVYLMAMMIMSFLIIISPIFIACIFSAPTFQYFENWLKSLMSTMIQPILVLCYVTLAFLILDKMMYDEEMGLAKQLPVDEISDYWNGKSAPGDVTVMNNPGDFAQHLGVDESYLRENYADSPVNPTFAGATAVDWWNEMYTFDFRGEGVSKTQKVFFSMVALILMAYLLDTILQSLASLAQQLLGSGFALAKAAGEGSIVEQKLESMQNTMHSQGSAAAGNSPGVAGFFTGLTEGGRAAAADVFRFR